MTDARLFTAVIPVKRWADAKRRLGLPPAIRSDLAQAFAEDVVLTVTRTRRVGRVVVVSSEPGLRDVVARCGVTLVEDPSVVGSDLLNAAIAAGVDWALRAHPADPVVVVPADLPCLTPEALADVLVAADGQERAMVADASGDGTTLLLAKAPHLLDPAYGVGSAQRHRALGHHSLDVPRSMRRDVDSLADLAEAVALGVGRSTDEVLRRHPADLAG